MLPQAPGLFSTSTVCYSVANIFCASTREMMSDALPGGNVLAMRTVLVGKSLCAKAEAQAGTQQHGTEQPGPCPVRCSHQVSPVCGLSNRGFLRPMYSATSVHMRSVTERMWVRVAVVNVLPRYTDHGTLRKVPKGACACSTTRGVAVAAHRSYTRGMKTAIARA